jgi:phosphate transport system permease protein
MSAREMVATGPVGRAPRTARARDIAFRMTLLWCLAAAVVALGVLLYDVAFDGLKVVSWDFLTSFPSAFPQRAGIQSALVGTIWLMVVCAAFIVPVGVASALYLEEYADRDKWWNRLIEVNIQNLAAVPSIVYGILGLAFLVRGPLSLGRVVLAGALTLGLLVLPVVIITAREAIRAVPPSIREGALALGATHWQTIWRQVLPAAVPGIATGVILALSRAIGETAPLILVGAATYVAFNPSGLNDAFTALPLQIFNWLTHADADFRLKAAGAILVLMALLMVMNGVAIWLRNRFERKW